MRITAAMVLLLVGEMAAGTITFIGFGAPAIVAVRVGAPAGTTTVNFNVAANSVGSGTPVTGSPTGVFVGAAARHPFVFPFPVFTLTVDSSTPLSNGVDTISFTEIQWTAASGDIPSGSFNGTPGQVILTQFAAFVVIDAHTFSYSNTTLTSAGTYTSQVTYTAAVP